MNETGAKECCWCKLSDQSPFYFIKLSNAWIVHTPVLVFGFPWNLSHLVSWWTPLPWKKPSNAVNRDDRLAEGISTEQITLKAMNDEPEPLNHLKLVVESKEHSFTCFEIQKSTSNSDLEADCLTSPFKRSTTAVWMKLVKPWNSFKRALLEKQPTILDGL